MLTTDSFAALYRDHHSDLVLSVYLDADDHDPASRAAWRVRLDNILADAEPDAEDANLGSAFRQAEARIRGALEDVPAFLPGRGWVGFATATELLHAESTGVPMPNLARFGTGVMVAPYVRALKQNRPVITVIVDGQHARVFQYREARLEPIQELESDTALGDLSDAGGAKRASTTSGMRGETRTDAARRFLHVGTERMLKRLADVVLHYAGRHGLVLVGGTAETVPAIAGRLGALEDRLLTNLSLHIGMSETDVLAATEEAATQLSSRLAAAKLAAILDAARSGGLGCLGVEATEGALGNRAVETLALSRRFIAATPGAADDLVGQALLQGSEIIELGDSAGDSLDADAEGVAAALRFRAT